VVTIPKNKIIQCHKYISWIYNIPRDYYFIVLITIIVYFISYLRYPATPGNLNQHFMGWFEWCDQGWYLKSAKAIAHWGLSPETYIYPLGYPLLGVPFLKLLPRHPFLIPNLFFSVGIVLTFYASCRKLVSIAESSVLTFFLIIFSAFTNAKAISGGLLWFNSLIIPWNLIPVFFAAYLATWLLVFNKANFIRLWIVSLAIALAFFARPPDVLFLGIIYLAGLIDLKSAKEKIQGLMIFIFPCLFFLAIILISKWAIFHSLLSQYDINACNIGFSLHDLLFKFYLIFFDGSPICGFRELMLIPQMPWLLLCIPGIIILARHTNAKSWFLMASIMLCLTIYISFNAQVPSSTFNYHGYRYFMWVFPWLGLCAYLTLTSFFKGIAGWKTIVGILVGVLVALTIGWKESVVATISPGVKQNVGEVYELYNLNSRRFSSEISLPILTLADGIKIVFSKVPSRNMQVSAEWHNFDLIVDGRKQVLYHDYNLYQSGDVVYVSFRNPINQTGKFQKAFFQYDNTDFSAIDKIYILRKEFKLFGFFQKMLMYFGIVAEDYSIYVDKLKIIPSSETPHTVGKFDPVTNTMVSGRSQGGALIYGPYSMLRPGYYQATYFVTAESAVTGSEVGTIDVSGYIPNKIDKQLAMVPLKSACGEQIIKLDFDANNLKYLYQFRVWVNGIGDRVSVRNIHVNRIKRKKNN
jgi:hypothetical protein